MNTILGANGAIAQALSRVPALGSSAIRQVSRHPRRVNPTDETVVADLMDAKATAQAVAGSEVVYLVAGLKYDTSVWREQWPRLMRNVIDACSRHGARLVFLDNVYAYGRVDGPMTEETPFNPISKKGEVRARIASMLLDEMRSGNLQALIARSADFYGPNVANSFPHNTVFSRLKNGKAPQWIGNPHKVHSFTYTPDIGPALAVLGGSPAAYGQTWHLPTTKEPLTGADFVRLACESAGQAYRLQTLPRWLLKFMAVFMPVLRENEEMMYQFDSDYRFDSSKIETAYGLQATSYRCGIDNAVRAVMPPPV
ncbi:NAD-dependent epimerase/dehydratase family protein [Zobellella sp. An-6]|uniref:NAD-dependent epimerase/dehydratase family protein n=1 Tax=Zobellella sp. An-6 TaxID=3400218 RepID=UPI004041EA88